MNDKIPLDALIKEAERELRMRRTVYARRVETGAMTQQQADWQIRAQAQIVELLRGMQKEQQQSLF